MRTVDPGGTAGSRDIRAARPESALHAATVAGARALGRDDLGPDRRRRQGGPGAGRPRPSADAAARDPLRSLVYHAADRAVRTVLVDGVVAYDNGKALGLDVASAAATLAKAQARMIRDAPARLCPPPGDAIRRSACRWGEVPADPPLHARLLAAGGGLLLPPAARIPAPAHAGASSSKGGSGLRPAR